MQKAQYRQENGNVLFFILIAVALFAALGFVVSSGREGTQGTASATQARIDAAEIMQYGTNLGLIAEKMMTVGGVDDSNTGGNGILFAAPTAHADYGTPGTQPRTEIFNKAGGDATYMKPPALACSSTCTYDFTGQIIVEGMKDDTKHELAMVVAGVLPEVCTQINNIWQHGFASVPTEDPLVLERFDGTNYGGASPITIGTPFERMKGFCYRENAGGQRYIYVHVLKRR